MKKIFILFIIVFLILMSSCENKNDFNNFINDSNVDTSNYSNEKNDDNLTNVKDTNTDFTENNSYLYEKYTPDLYDIDVKTFQQWQEIINGNSISNNCQSMDIFNDYIFNFSAYDDVYITSLTNKNYNFHTKIPYSGHCNSAQFINVFYDVEDTYPLLLISKCEIGDVINWNTINVIRVIEKDGIFYFYLLKTITFYDDSFKWGSSFIYDAINNRFISISNSNGPYNDYSDNSNVILSFEGPNNWTDGVDEIRKNGELIYKLPSHIVFQGLEIHNDYLIIGAQISDNVNDYWFENSGVTGTAILIYNLATSQIKLLKINKIEIEGVCYYNNVFFVQSHLSISENINEECLWISKFEYYL